MTTDIKALRAKFEAWATAAYRLSFDDDTPLKRYLWAAYQAGHAAAKAETAAAVAAERERCLRIVQSVDNYSNPMTANDCADAIRAGAKGEPS